MKQYPVRLTSFSTKILPKDCCKFVVSFHFGAKPPRADKFIRAHLSDIKGESLILSGDLNKKKLSIRDDVKTSDVCDEKKPADNVNDQEPIGLKIKSNEIDPKVLALATDILENESSDETDDNDYNRSVETWRGKPTVKIPACESTSKIFCNKGKCPSKNFKNYPECKFQNYNSRTLKSSFLLRNGNKYTPLREKGLLIYVENTCPFDSIIHVLLCAIYDNSFYESFVKSSTHNISNFLITLTKLSKGITPEVKKDRINLLSPHYERKVDSKNPRNVTINVFDNVTRAWEKMMCTSEIENSNPSAYLHKRCSRPNCIREITSMSHIGVDHSIISSRESQAFEKAIQFNGSVQATKCFRNHCNGMVTSFLDFENHFFLT